jgi:hypothetical protein
MKNRTICAGDGVSQILKELSDYGLASLDRGRDQKPLLIVSMELHLLAIQHKDNEIRSLLEKLNPKVTPLEVTPLEKKPRPKKPKGK